MKEAVELLLQKAGKALDAARRDLKAGEAGFAADRPYYGMLITSGDKFLAAAREFLASAG